VARERRGAEGNWEMMKWSRGSEMGFLVILSKEFEELGGINISEEEMEGLSRGK
jgi:hypothetical protein